MAHTHVVQRLDAVPPCPYQRRLGAAALPPHEQPYPLPLALTVAIDATG